MIYIEIQIKEIIWLGNQLNTPLEAIVTLWQIIPYHCLNKCLLWLFVWSFSSKNLGIKRSRKPPATSLWARSGSISRQRREPSIWRRKNTFFLTQVVFAVFAQVKEMKWGFAQKPSSSNVFQSSGEPFVRKPFCSLQRKQTVFTGPRCPWGPIYGSRPLYLTEAFGWNFVDVIIPTQHQVMMPRGQFGGDGCHFIAWNVGSSVYLAMI